MRMRRELGCCVLGFILSSSSAAVAQRADATRIVDLPLREIPATASAPPSDVVAIFLTGDGGWAAIDREVAGVLAAHGVAVVGLDTRSYLSTKRTPEELGRDVARVARAYMARWNRTRIVLAGYSRGADLAPFAANQLPPDLKNRVALIAMLGLAPAVGFQMHWRDLLEDVHRPTDLPTLPEITRLRGTPMLCVYGTEEARSGCRDAPAGLMRVVPREGKHHFDGDYRSLGELIWSAIP